MLNWGTIGRKKQKNSSWLKHQKLTIMQCLRGINCSLYYVDKVPNLQWRKAETDSSRNHPVKHSCLRNWFKQSDSYLTLLSFKMFTYNYYSSSGFSGPFRMVTYITGFLSWTNSGRRGTGVLMSALWNQSSEDVVFQLYHIPLGSSITSGEIIAIQKKVSGAISDIFMEHLYSCT